MKIPKGGWWILAMAVAAIWTSRSPRCATGFCGPAILLPPAGMAPGMADLGVKPGGEVAADAQDASTLQAEGKGTP